MKKIKDNNGAAKPSPEAKAKTIKIDTASLVFAAMILALTILIALVFNVSLRIGPVEITLLPIPVAIGAIFLGYWWGAFFGFVFGLISFLQCLGGIFGLSAFGQTLLGINAFYTVLLCFVPRILMGLLVGFIFKMLNKLDRKHQLSYIISALSAPILNTLFFLGGLILLFGSNPEFLGLFGNSIVKVVTSLITMNALIEAGVCLVIGYAISKTIAIVGKNFINKTS